MRRFVRILIFIVVLVLIVFGIRAYNVNKYTADVPYKDRAAVLADGDGTAVDGQYLNGVHFAPTEQTKAGTVVMFSGSEGGIPVDQARALRDQGFNVLTLYFFGQPNQQTELADVPLDFFQEALDWIDANASPGPLTVLGTSKGAELTANLATRYPEIDNIVLYTPSEYNYFGLKYDQNQYSSWTWKGAPIPTIPNRPSGKTMGTLLVRMLILGLPVSFRPTYEESVANAANRDEARIDITAFQGNGLVFAGDQDAMWQGDIAAANLAAANPSLEAHIFPDAGHIFSANMEVFGEGWPTMMGGTAEGNRIAAEESEKILNERLATWHATQ